jgi:hypothetical protein
MLDGVVIDDSGLFNEKHQEWENFYRSPQTPRRTGWPDPLRSATTEIRDHRVIDLRQLHT